jgi:hypothetical protein
MSHFEQNTLTYAICNVSTDLANINFNEVVTTSAETIRKSVDETLFVTKWITTPPFIVDGTVVPSHILNHADTLILMATPEWTNSIPPL